MSPLPPGSTIGVLGGGQLGRMLAIAAAKLGLKTHIYAPEADSPAADVAARFTCAAYDDEAALAAFAADIDAATTEFENVPAATAAFLAARVPMRPSARALAIAQDRVAEKQFLNDAGPATAPWAAIDDAAALTQALARIARALDTYLRYRRRPYDDGAVCAVAPPTTTNDDDDHK